MTCIGKLETKKSICSLYYSRTRVEHNSLSYGYESATERLNSDKKFINRAVVNFERLGAKSDTNHLIQGIFGKEKSVFSAIESREIRGEYEDKFEAGSILY